jgi:hypothetical protein
MTRALRTYARLVHLYPSAFRNAYGEDMVALLTAQLRDESRTRVYTRAAADLVLTLPTRHLEAHMKLPARSVPKLAFCVALVATATAMIGGPMLPAATVALVAAAFAYAAGRREQPAHEPEARPGRRSVSFLGAGAAVLVLISFAPQDGPEGLWFVFMAALLTGIAAVTIGVLYGINFLMGRQRA